MLKFDQKKFKQIVLLIYLNRGLLNLDDAIVLETFSNRIEAEMAAGLLESEGIEAMVMADDAGGTYPCSSCPGGAPHGVQRGRGPGQRNPGGHGRGGGPHRRTLTFFYRNRFAASPPCPARPAVGADLGVRPERGPTRRSIPH